MNASFPNSSLNGRRLRTLGLAAAVLTIVGAAGAQMTDTGFNETEAVFTEEAAAERWHLSVNEWTEYERLMQGPRGIWSPNLDPVTILGIHAASDAERRRYAELLVTIEFERVEQELRFQEAYDAAARRLFPNLPRIESAGGELAAGLRTTSSGSERDRLAFVGSISSARCPACQATLVRVLGQGATPAAPVLDLFLADAPDDAALRAWAGEVGLDPTAVRDGRITLNHAHPPFVLPGVATTTTPRLLRRRAGRWLPIEPAP